MLHTLKLYLSYNKIGDAGAQALASLKEAPLLHTLSLDLFRVGEHRYRELGL